MSSFGNRSMQVGIMADSHGDAEAIGAALELFHKRNCRRIYHLGDICDSLRPETVDACIRPLRSARVICIRGNNDHSILMNLKGRTDGSISDDSRDYLEKLPLKASFCDAELVHSLPFTEELGLAAMIGSMEPEDAERYFDSSGRPVLFRAHGHSPELMGYRNGQYLTRPLQSAETVDLTAYRRCIITCGALARGSCLIWRPAQRLVSCLSLSDH